MPGTRAAGFPPSAFISFMLAVMALVATCRLPQAHAAPKTGVGLRWAGVTYSLHEPVLGAVELRVIVGNRTAVATESTSILWDPVFAASYSFLQSSPAPWRVRIAENGWGTLDTDGVAAQEDGSFVMWFVAAPGVVDTGRDLPVRIEVVANGNVVVGQGIATAAHATEKQRLARQTAFDRSPAAGLGDALWFIPAASSAAFPVATALAVAMAVLASTGAAAALRAASRVPGAVAPVGGAAAARPAVG